MHPDGGGHRTHKRRCPAHRGGAKNGRPQHKGRAMVFFLQQFERRGHHGFTGVAAVVHGRQIGRLNADVQAQHAPAAFLGPQVLGHKILRARPCRMDGKFRQPLRADRRVGPHARLERRALLGGHIAGKRKVAHPGVALAHIQFAGGTLKLGAAEHGVDHEQAAQAIDDFGVCGHALGQGIGECPRVLQKTGLGDCDHRPHLLLRQQPCGQKPQHSHGHAQGPVPVMDRDGGKFHPGMRLFNTAATTITGQVRYPKNSGIHQPALARRKKPRSSAFCPPNGGCRWHILRAQWCC